MTTQAYKDMNTTQQNGTAGAGAASASTQAGSQGAHGRQAEAARAAQERFPDPTPGTAQAQALASYMAGLRSAFEDGFLAGFAAGERHQGGGSRNGTTIVGPNPDAPKGSENDPTWPRYVKGRGVLVPGTSIVLDRQNILPGQNAGRMDWKGAVDIAGKRGKRLPTTDELLYIKEYIDRLNFVLGRHGGDPLLGKRYWSSERTMDRNEEAAFYRDLGREGKPSLDKSPVDELLYARAVSEL